MMRLKLSIFLQVFLFSFSTKAQETIKLYDGVPPGSENATWHEETSTKNMFNTEVIYNVKEPSIIAYLPPKHLATGTAIIVAPGGAFHTLSINNEGIDVAKWLNSNGIAAFVLKYRVAPSYTNDPVQELMAKMGDFEKLDIENAPFVKLASQDGIKAIEYVRSHAVEMDIDPNKIGIMGFSAGGTLAMSVVYSAPEASKPNFVAPIYAYEKAILGNEIPSKKTPIFITVAGDDQLGMMPMSISIYKKWFDAGQPAELHIYEKGGHGFGMRSQNLPVDTWYERFGDWLRLQGLRTKLYPSKYEKLYGELAVEQDAIAHDIRLKNDIGGTERYKAVNEKDKNKAIKAVLIGDSITDAWFSKDSSFFQNNNFIGRGISAQTSTQLLIRFRQDVVDLKPEKVLIHIGTNDIAENTGPYRLQVTLDNMESMIDIAQKSDIEVILASVLPATKFEWRLGLGDKSDEIIKLNMHIKSLAQKRGLKYVDYHSLLKNEQNGMNKDFAEDGVHPTMKAYKIMGEQVLKALK